MNKPKKQIITPQWLKIKKMYDEGTNGSSEWGTNFPIGGELHQLALGFAEDLALLTEHFGFNCVVEDIKMDLWKDRIWNLMKSAGLFREKWGFNDEDIDDEIEDDDDNWISPIKSGGDFEFQEPSDDELRSIENSFL